MLMLTHVHRVEKKVIQGVKDEAKDRDLKWKKYILDLYNIYFFFY